MLLLITQRSCDISYIHPTIKSIILFRPEWNKHVLQIIIL